MERQPDSRIDALLRAVNEAHDAANNVVPIERAPSYQAPQPEQQPLLDQPAEAGNTETELERGQRLMADAARANIVQYFEDETPPYEVPDTSTDVDAA